MTKKLCRRIFYGDTDEARRIQSFEAAYKKPIRDIPLKRLTVGADDSLVEAKVYDLVVQGCEDDAGLYQMLARIVNMIKEKENVPFITADDFSLKKWVSGTAAPASGGGYWSVELDCSLDKGLYAADVNLSRTWLRSHGFDALEEALRAMGQAVGRHLVSAVVTKYLTDVDSTMTNSLANWGNGHYKTLVKMESLIANVGMAPDIVLLNPAEGYDVGISDYFIKAEYERAARGIPKTINGIGALYGWIPIIRHRDMTENSMLMAASQKAIALGIMEGGPIIEGYEDVRKGLDGSVVSIQYDVKSAKDASGAKDSTNPCAKAWAVATAA